MTRIILSQLNSLFFALIALVGISIQTTLFKAPVLSYFEPDLILFAVLWCALHRPFTEGGILTLLFGYFSELHSASPSGAFLITYMATYLFVRASIKYIVLPKRSSLVLFSMALTVLWRLGLMGTMSLMGINNTLWKHFFVFALLSSAVQGMLTLPVFRLLDRFDWLTFKNPRARSQLEDELKLEGEGL